jgi:alkylhydroperoxidase family enzyme
MQGVSADAVDAIRDGDPIDESRLEALRDFTNKVVDTRGWVKEGEIEAFLDAGFNLAQVLEVILGVAFKTISNYANHIAETPLDDAFTAKAWSPRTG